MTTPNLSLTAIKLGDSATPSKNFIISVPDIPDGTLTIERADGTDVLTVDAAGKVNFPGNAQTCKTVAIGDGVPKTNNTGQPIHLSVRFLGGVNVTLNGEITIDGVVWTRVHVPAGALVGAYAYIPAGSSYTCGIGGDGTIYAATEIS